MSRFYRMVPSAPGKTIYLSFDDGPHPSCTPEVLKLLASRGASATFFVVAERAASVRGLAREIAAEGHALGNHSLDHRFRNFFSSKETMRAWIAASETALSALLGEAPIGFRSPAGVRTPPLRWALSELKLPLIHWHKRFYDTSFGWPAKRALRSLASTPSGSIVLLHDTHEGLRKAEFLATLAAYLDEAKTRGFTFQAIPRLPA